MTDITLERMISYEATAECIGEKLFSSRWRTVTTAWRKQLYREHNILMRAEPKTGFVPSKPGERVHISASGFKSGIRKAVRSGDIALRTEKGTLKPDELRACDHVVRAAAAIKLAAATAAKQLKLPDANNGKVADG